MNDNNNKEEFVIRETFRYNHYELGIMRTSPLWDNLIALDMFLDSDKE